MILEIFLPKQRLPISRFHVPAMRCNARLLIHVLAASRFVLTRIGWNSDTCQNTESIPNGRPYPTAMIASYWLMDSYDNGMYIFYARRYPDLTSSKVITNGRTNLGGNASTSSANPWLITFEVRKRLCPFMLDRHSSRSR
jgi:hypothetical protein